MRTSRIVLAAAVAGCILIPATAGASSLVIEKVTPAEAEAMKASWSESRSGLRERSRLDENQLILPFFVVDTESPSGVTTLFAIQADIEFSTPVHIEYENLFGVVFREENEILAPSSVLTINLRDKNPPPLVAGLAFGRVLIETNTGLWINGDYYQVDPGDNFGHGDGLISIDDMCLIEDVRYAAGGIFDDTVITFHYLLLTLAADGGMPAAIVEVYTEGGLLADTFQLILADIRTRADFLTASYILDQLGGGPAFGTFRFYWNPDTVGAAVTKNSTSAQGRFSVGLQGACRLGLIEVL